MRRERMRSKRRMLCCPACLSAFLPASLPANRIPRLRSCSDGLSSLPDFVFHSDTLFFHVDFCVETQGHLGSFFFFSTLQSVDDCMA